MIAFLYEYGIFLAKSLTIVLSILTVLFAASSLRGKSSSGSKNGKIVISNLNEELEDIKFQMEDALCIDEDSDASKTSKTKEIDEGTTEKTGKTEKTEKKWWQFFKKADANSIQEAKKRVFVVAFDGDVDASEVHNLRNEITAILQIAKPEDEVVVKITSPGGVVHGYGLCASQLARVKEAGVYLTVSIDEVAASGGYLMACVADKILAAPFSIVGSIGVVAGLPNFHKILEKYGINYEQFTAGKYKRTVTMFGENTDEARDKFKEELESVHIIFKNFITQYRPKVNIEEIATGEHWLAIDAIKFGLVDELITSDSYLMKKQDSSHILQITYEEIETMNQKISSFFNFLGKTISRKIYSSY